MLQKIVIAIILCGLGIVCLVARGYLCRKQRKQETKASEKTRSGEKVGATRGILRGKISFRGVMAAVLVLLLITIAAGTAVRFLGEKKESDDIPNPTLPGAVGSTEDLFPNKRGDMLWDLLYGGTHGGEGTVAEKLEEKVEAIREMLDSARNEEGYFDFPEGFRLHPAVPDAELKTADTLEAYDRQLAYQVAKKEYYWTANLALSCLDLCTRTGEQDVAKYEYYAKLAVWGLSNRYVSLGKEAPSTKLVDLNYWAGQVFDHLGGAVVGDMKQNMYLVSAAFLEMAVRELEVNGFRGDVVDADICWGLYYTMLVRLGLEMDPGVSHDAGAAARRRSIS